MGGNNVDPKLILIFFKKPSGAFTYPLNVILDFPTTPSAELLDELLARFSVTFKRHIFLEHVRIPAASYDSLPPYLRYSMACLAAVSATHHRMDAPSTQALESLQEDTATPLFYAAVKLFTVMIELDNRLARKLESIISVSVWVNLVIDKNPTKAAIMYTIGIPHRHIRRAYNRD